MARWLEHALSVVIDTVTSLFFNHEGLICVKWCSEIFPPPLSQRNSRSGIKGLSASVTTVDTEVSASDIAGCVTAEKNDGTHEVNLVTRGQ